MLASGQAGEAEAREPSPHHPDMTRPGTTTTAARVSRFQLPEGYDMFGNHVPTEVRDKGPQSPAAVFTRGLQLSGKQWRYEFPNGFGASVISDGYGSEQGLFELAVLQDGHLTYSTPITDDVLGYLTAEEVAATLDKIAALEAKDITAEKVRRLREEIAEREKEIAALEGGAR